MIFLLKKVLKNRSSLLIYAKSLTFDHLLRIFILTHSVESQRA
jgi:hypothetical protein